MGSGRKRDVSSHGFLIGAVPLHPKNAIPPCVSLPSFAYSPHFLCLHIHAHMESISR